MACVLNHVSATKVLAERVKSVVQFRLVLDQMLTKVRSQPLGLDQSLDLSLVLDQIAGVRSNSVLSLDLDPSLVSDFSLSL